MKKGNYRPVVLVILDGWGHSDKIKGNPIQKASLPTMEKLDQYYPKILLQASGLSVGLPWGEEGNSEVGHQSISSGVVIYQNLPRINLSIEDGSFYQNEVIKNACSQCKKKGRRLHLLGLLSDGGVHSHINHLQAILETIKSQDFEEIFIHAILDGRDTAANKGVDFLEMIQQKMKSLGLGKLATITGRYYTMDRNNNWDRIEKAFVCMTEGRGIATKDPIEAVKKQYKKKVSDEYIEPIVVQGKEDEPLGLIENGDCVFFTNFRKDRARQITEAFVSPKFKNFSKEVKRPNLSSFISMTQYDKKVPVSGIVFPPIEIEDCLGKVLANYKKNQLRIAETEKYAHVTYFFNMGKEKPFLGEDRIMVPSKNVPSYDTAPEMSAEEITQKLTEEVRKEKYDFILVNYANPDMVGHTGNFKACVKAIEKIDSCVDRLVTEVISRHGCLLITADHGNVEELINFRTGARDTKHSINPVPLWFVTADNHRSVPQNKKTTGISPSGILCDIAPTVLDLMDLPKPDSMNCTSLTKYLENKT